MAAGEVIESGKTPTTPPELTKLVLRHVERTLELDAPETPVEENSP